MTLQVIVLIVFVGLLCFLGGFGIATALYSPKIEGKLVVMSDKEDGGDPYLYLNINKHPDKLLDGQTAIFIVEKKDPIVEKKDPIVYSSKGDKK